MSKKKKHKQRLKDHSEKKKNTHKKVTIKTDFFLKKKIFWLLLGVILLLALIVRLQSFSDIAKEGRVQLQGADAYLFVRQAENISEGGFAKKDPILCFDDGYSTDRTLYPYILAILGQVMTLEWAAAISSPFFALLSFGAVFLLLREMFPKNDFAVIGGTALAALTGIQLYSRSFFGMGDYHVLETFFSFFGLFALVKALRNDKWVWSLIAGVSLAMYAISWFPSSIFIGLIALAMILIYIFADKLPDHLWKHIVIIFIVILSSHFLIPNRYITLVSSGFIVLVPVLELLRGKIDNKYYRLGLITITFGVLLFVVNLINANILHKVGEYINEVLFAGNLEQNIKEMESMYNIYSRALKANFLLYGWIQVAVFIFAIAGITTGKEDNRRIFWYMLLSIAIIMLISYVSGNYLLLGFLFLWIMYFKNWKQILFFFLGLSWAIMALLHIRFEYYFVIFVGVGTAYIITRHRYIMWGCLLAGILFTISMWISQSNTSNAFPDSYFKTALWMREFTADPGVADAGEYIFYKTPEYGVLGNWETGYIYAYKSKRPQVTSPSHCNYKMPSEFFMMTDEDVAYKYAKDNNIKYIVVDSPTLFRYFYHSAQAQKPTLETRRVNIQNEQATLIESAYYKTMYARMYNFNGNDYTATNTFVVNDNEVKYFKNFDDAQNYIKNNGGDYYSYDLKVSPISLVKLKHFKLIHSEGDWVNGAKVFEVVD